MWWRSARLMSATTAPVSTSARATKCLAREFPDVGRLQLLDAPRRDQVNRERVEACAPGFLVQIVVERAHDGFGPCDSTLRAVLRQLFFHARGNTCIDDVAHGISRGCITMNYNCNTTLDGWLKAERA